LICLGWIQKLLSAHAPRAPESRPQKNGVDLNGDSPDGVVMDGCCASSAGLSRRRTLLIVARSGGVTDPREILGRLRAHQEPLRAELPHGLDDACGSASPDASGRHEGKRCRQPGTRWGAGPAWRRADPRVSRAWRAQPRASSSSVRRSIGGRAITRKSFTPTCAYGERCSTSCSGVPANIPSHSAATSMPSPSARTRNCSWPRARRLRAPPARQAAGGSPSARGPPRRSAPPARRACACTRPWAFHPSAWATTWRSVGFWIVVDASLARVDRRADRGGCARPVRTSAVRNSPVRPIL
jgi:hypothetical protein